MAWSQLFGGGHPKGTLADMAERYPEDLAEEQNRSIGIGALQPFAELMRPTVNAARAIYSALPDSSTTQARKLRARLNAPMQETQPYVVRALEDYQNQRQQLAPPALPQSDAEFVQRVYAPGTAQEQNQVMGTTPNRAPVRSPQSSSDMDASAAQQQEQARLYPEPQKKPSPRYPHVDADAETRWQRDPKNAADLRQRYLKSKGFNPLEQEFVAGDGSQPANIYYKVEDGRHPSGSGGVKTRYEIPGLSQVGGQGKGYAEFQGERKGGGSFSVLAGRTKEEQAAIDETVAGINRQIDAIRALNGKPSLADEALMKRIQQMQETLLPNQPDQDLRSQQAQLRAGLMQMLTGQQAEQRKGQSERDWEMLKLRAEYGDKQAQRELDRQKAQSEEYDRGYRRRQDDQRFALEQQQYLNPAVDPIQKQKYLTDAVNEFLADSARPGEAPSFDGTGFSKRYNILVLTGDQEPQQLLTPYYSQKEGQFVMVSPQGKTITMDPEEALDWRMRMAR